LKIGPCSALIYIGEHRTETKDDELNGIVEKFQEVNKAIYVSEENLSKKLFYFFYFRSIVEWKLMKFMKILRKIYLNICENKYTPASFSLCLMQFFFVTFFLHLVFS
jgi:hypothetical protein